VKPQSIISEENVDSKL